MEYNVRISRQEYELIKKLRAIDEESRLISWQEGVELLCQGEPIIVKHYNRMTGEWSEYEYRTDADGTFVLFNHVTKCFDYEQQLDADDVLMGKWYKKSR